MVNHTKTILHLNESQNGGVGMLPEMEAQGAESRALTARAGRKRSKRRVAPAVAGDAGQPAARVMQLVAALKVEQEAGSPLSLASDAAERVKMMEWLRRFLAAREEERSAWELRIKQLEAQLQTAETAAASADRSTESTLAQHERVIADLKLMHEHQRSIWQLERRQLEISLAALEKARGRSVLRRAARLARPAVAAALILVSLAAVALSADSHAVGSSAQLYLDDGPSAGILLGAN